MKSARRSCYFLCFATYNDRFSLVLIAGVQKHLFQAVFPINMPNRSRKKCWTRPKNGPRWHPGRKEQEPGPRGSNGESSSSRSTQQGTNHERSRCPLATGVSCSTLQPLSGSQSASQAPSRKLSQSQDNKLSQSQENSQPMSQPSSMDGLASQAVSSRLPALAAADSQVIV